MPDAATVPPAAIVAQPLPPAAGQELEEAQPSAQHVRIPAHWRWQEGHYAWIPPHWELPPVANATWVEPRWEKQGNGFVLSGGFWQQSAAPAAAVVEVPSAPPRRPWSWSMSRLRRRTREIIVERPSRFARLDQRLLGVARGPARLGWRALGTAAAGSRGLG